MNALLSPRSCLLLVFALACVPIFAAVACAAGPSAEMTTTSILHASILMELVADRARLIQVSLVVVAVGCALIWWYR
ncbi:MAG: hypothetical protein HY289_00290 [Planctomycetes bacterium]|nr:hypothetical protein [Planctomycetota bacterium]